jgi:hypothetical protein
MQCPPAYSPISISHSNPPKNISGRCRLPNRQWPRHLLDINSSSLFPPRHSLLASRLSSSQVLDDSQGQLAIQNVASLVKALGNLGPETQPIHMYSKTYYLIVDKVDNTWQIGKVGDLEQVDEYRVEAICVGREIAVKAVEALKKYSITPREPDPCLTRTGHIHTKSQRTRSTKWRICDA